MKKILNIQYIRLKDLKFKEVKCPNQNNNKFLLYQKGYGFREFFLFSSKGFKLINVIN